MVEPEKHPRALVTGASSGLGAAFAEQLARDGYDLLVVARRRERLETLAHRLHAQHPVAVEVVVADLTDPAALRDVEHRAASDPALELLVNNAGFAGYTPFVELAPDRAEELIRVHVLATTRLTRAALPGMIARGRGAVLNVASLLAFSGPLPPRPLPFRATYAACKAYLLTFTQLLHHELAGTNVRVQVLCPGVVDTEFLDLAGIDRARLPVPPVAAAPIVQASLAGLRLGEVICAPTVREVSFLAQVQESQRRLLEHIRGIDTVAARYTAMSPPS